MGKLTPKQERFVEEYLVDLNATQAALRAGYKHGELGRRLVTKSHVSSAIAKAKAKRSKRTEITQDMVIAELAKLGFSNMGDYMKVTPDGDPRLHFDELTREQTAALSEVTVEDFTDGRGEDKRDVRKVKFKLYDKRAALADLLAHDETAVNRLPNRSDLIVVVVQG